MAESYHADNDGLIRPPIGESQETPILQDNPVNGSIISRGQ
jgi:hypothetical protein